MKLLSRMFIAAMLVFLLAGSLFAQHNPRVVAQELIDFDLTHPADGTVEVRIWITARPAYVLEGPDVDLDIHAHNQGGHFIILYNLGNFGGLGSPNDWSPGETVRTEAVHIPSGRIATNSFVISTGTSPIIRYREHFYYEDDRAMYLGEPLFNSRPDTLDPIMTDASIMSHTGGVYRINDWAVGKSASVTFSTVGINDRLLFRSLMRREFDLDQYQIGPRSFKVEYRIGEGDWVELSAVSLPNSEAQKPVDFELPEACYGQESVSVRWYLYEVSGFDLFGNGWAEIFDVIVTGVVAEPEFELVIGIEGEGTTVPEVGTHTYAEGTVVELTGVPGEGWLFNKWVVDEEIFDTSVVNVEMFDDVMAKAFFIEMPADVPEDEEDVTEGDDVEVDFPNNGIKIQFTGNVPGQTITSKLFNIRPFVVIPAGSPVENIAPRFWNIVSTSGSPGHYSITFDITGIPGIADPWQLHLLKRASNAVGWVDYGTPSDVDGMLVTWTGLDSFSEFTLGGYGVNTLPVELSTFTASVTANMFVELMWVSETETNMLGYNVFRGLQSSVNDAEMITASIISASNSSSTTNYTFVDQDVYPGETYYYWLESVDLDLTSTFHGPVAVTVEEEVEIPQPEYVTALRRNFPNPFNPETTIKFSLREDVEMMELKIYNILGQVVRTLVSAGPHNKGDYQIVWDGTTDSGKAATSGVYFYRMTTPNYNKIHKMLLMK